MDRRSSPVSDRLWDIGSRINRRGRRGRIRRPRGAGQADRPPGGGVRIIHDPAGGGRRVIILAILFFPLLVLAELLKISK